MSKHLITVSGVSQVTLDVTPEALALKRGALTAAKEIKAVTSTEDQEKAVAAASDIKGILKTLEKSRTEIKAPVLELGKKIDKIAKDYAAELATEDSRLTGLVQTFYRSEQERIRQEQAFADRMEAKRVAAAEAEAKKIQEEADKASAAALNATTEEEAARLDAEAKQRQEDLEIAQAKIEKAQQSAPVIAGPAKTEKMAVKKTKKFEVLDIHALYMARPDLVKIEASASLINAAMRDGAKEIPGLRIWEEDDISFRA